MINASNNPFPCEPDIHFHGKLDRGGYNGTAKNLKDEIDKLANPDRFTIIGSIHKNGNNIKINALDFSWWLNQIEYSNSIDFESTISNEIEGYYRHDIIVATRFSTFVKIEGVANSSSNFAFEPSTPLGTLKVTTISIFGEHISDQFPTAPDTNKPIPYLYLKLISKGVGNLLETTEQPGDFFEGFKDETTYWTRARWNGGSRTDRNNYTPIVEHEL